RASARSSEGRNLRCGGASISGVSTGWASGALVCSDSRATGASAGDGAASLFDQIAAAESSALAALGGGAAACSAAPFRSNPRPAPDETFSLISGIPVANYPMRNMAAAGNFFQPPDLFRTDIDGLTGLTETNGSRRDVIRYFSWLAIWVS